jgi:hypothetical protein
MVGHLCAYVFIRFMCFLLANVFIGKLGETRHKHTKAPKNCSHKFFFFAISFFGNVWTSHLELFLFVLIIFD